MSKEFPTVCSDGRRDEGSRGSESALRNINAEAPLLAVRNPPGRSRG